MSKKKTTNAKNRSILEYQMNAFETRNIADLSEEWTKIFASNVNIARITPHFIDGLKPSGRRLLYAMHENSSHGSKFKKVSATAGDTVNYHPHGEQSIYDVIYKFGQPWRNNINYIDPQGNYGNVRGDEPAAPRYTECKLSKAANFIFFNDFKQSNMPMRLSYTGESMEPDYLPARIPVVLCNPSFSGIGIGVATNIPSFNVSEVIAATIKLMKNPDANILLIPDSPTGCNIEDDGQFKKINEIGDDCTITMSATYDIDYQNNIITITSLPLRESSGAIVSTLVKMKKASKLDGLVDVQDFTAEDNVHLEIFLKSDENPDKFIEKLMAKRIGLRVTFPVEIRVIDDFKARVWGTKKLLLKWISYRRDCVRAIYNQKLTDTTNGHHMNEVYLMVFNKDNINKTAEIARTSTNKEEMQKRFIKEYGITTVQAATLSGMRYHQFTKDAYEGFKEVKKQTEDDMKEYEAILQDDDAVDEIIISQLKEADKLFGGPRKSAIIKAGKMEVKVPNTLHLIGVSRDGYVKKVNLEKGRIPIGTVGKCGQVLVCVINNRDNLMVFDSKGNISRVSVSALPDMEAEDIGVELNRYFTTDGDIVSIMSESDIKNSTGDIVVVTAKGIGKKIKLEEFYTIKDKKVAISLSEDDKLVAAIPAHEEDFIIYTNFGDGIRLNTKDIKRQKRTARGLSLITLKIGEVVEGINFIEEGCDKLLYVTSMGRLKLTEAKMMPTMNRKDTPISLIGLNANEKLVGVGFVNKKDKVTVYLKKNPPVTLKLTDIPVTTRIAKAEKLVKTSRGDVVTGFSVTRAK